MGLANRILSRFAKKVLTAFPPRYFPKGIQPKAVWTGVPVREEVLTGDRQKAFDDFGFDKSVPTVLFIGGSSGARGINKLVVDSLDDLLNFCQVIHITGKNDYQAIRKRGMALDQKRRIRYRYFDFVTRDLPDIFAASDLVVSRSGATTLTELAALGKPAILIPYPYAASDHQSANAKVLAKDQAAVVYQESELTPERLVGQIKRLIDNRRAMDNLSRNIKKFYKPNACDLIIEEINKV
jgi:UDP-N-acetylglucosamine--N-acetylmuramyl-(pentapeptide) pyrophosphoryl-undecaprenol N-acetylglucosamine transferase